MQAEMQTDIMTIREVADYLKLTEKTAYRLTAEGKIPGFKVSADRGVLGEMKLRNGLMRSISRS